MPKIRTTKAAPDLYLVEVTDTKRGGLRRVRWVKQWYPDLSKGAGCCAAFTAARPRAAQFDQDEARRCARRLTAEHVEGRSVTMVPQYIAEEAPPVHAKIQLTWAQVDRQPAPEVDGAQYVVQSADGRLWATAAEDATAPLATSEARDAARMNRAEADRAKAEMDVIFQRAGSAPWTVVIVDAILAAIGAKLADPVKVPTGPENAAKATAAIKKDAPLPKPLDDPALDEAAANGAAHATKGPVADARLYTVRNDAATWWVGTREGWAWAGAWTPGRPRVTPQCDRAVRLSHDEAAAVLAGAERHFPEEGPWRVELVPGTDGTPPLSGEAADDKPGRVLLRAPAGAAAEDDADTKGGDAAPGWDGLLALPARTSALGESVNEALAHLAARCAAIEAEVGAIARKLAEPQPVDASPKPESPPDSARLHPQLRWTWGGMRAQARLLGIEPDTAGWDDQVIGALRIIARITEGEMEAHGFHYTKAP